jgi:hypothetical protein
MAPRILTPFLTAAVAVSVWAGFCPAAEDATDVAGRWTRDRVWLWYNMQPWLVGCNFVPSTACNDVEMWQKETFDPETIDRELGWAEELGFNTVRVFVNYVVWEADAAGLKQRMTKFLEASDRHGIRAMFILFDDCFKPEPKVGRQDDPVPGVHNSQWVQSPGVHRRSDQEHWPMLEKYVKDVVGAFAQDKRVVIWDLYNEPSKSRPLVEAAFRWAREARPSQPLTSCWLGVDYSDILSFHCYGDLAAVRAEIEKLTPNRRGRPYLCTEWMARSAGSRFETHLPYFKQQNIGCWSWGLVAGRTQTYFPWGSKAGAPEPSPWFHDILRKDGQPFSAGEVRLIKVATGKLPPREPVVPTAERAAVTWRYLLEKPSDDWMKPAFDDSGWPEAPAPFGAPDARIGRAPRTLWTGEDLWLRRTFELTGSPRDAALLMQHDEDTEVYINGVLAAKVPAYNAAYEEFEITPEAKAALHQGKNLLAVHVRQKAGGQYIDVGILSDGN